MIYTAETRAENYDSSKFHMDVIASMLADCTLDYPLLVGDYVAKYRLARADFAVAREAYLGNFRKSVQA